VKINNQESPFFIRPCPCAVHSVYIALAALHAESPNDSYWILTCLLCINSLTLKLLLLPSADVTSRLFVNFLKEQVSVPSSVLYVRTASHWFLFLQLNKEKSWKFIFGDNSIITIENSFAFGILILFPDDTKCRLDCSKDLLPNLKSMEALHQFNYCINKSSI
jgi:hypothetical protein